MTAKTVDSTSDAQRLQLEDLKLTTSLYGGTTAMRAAGQAYLPQWPKEEDDAYAARLAVSTLFPGFKRTVDVLSSKPFSKPPTLDKIPPALGDDFTQNVDGRQNNLAVFAREALRNAMRDGHSLILTDHPPRPPGARTQADDAALKLRPYWVLIEKGQVLGWTTRTEGGVEVLDTFRFKETSEEHDGGWGTTTVERVRAFALVDSAPPELLAMAMDSGGTEGGERRVLWGVYERSSSNAGAVVNTPGAQRSGAWQLVEAGFIHGAQEIPLRAVYGERLGTLISRSPLRELAHLNVKHWQQQSDQDNLMHVARVPILWHRGGSDKTKLVVGAGTAVNLGDSPNAAMGFAEHSGAAIGAGATQLDALREDMRQAGAELLVMRPTPTTATEVATDNAVGMSALQEIALGLEDALASALQDALRFKSGADAGDAGRVKLYADFSAATLAEASASLLVGMNTAGKLSTPTLYKELKRRGTLSEGVDWDEEQAALELEGPVEPDPLDPPTPRQDPNAQ